MSTDPAPGQSSQPSNPPYLAKIYRLGENDQAWQDCGVVRVRCGFVDNLNDMALILVSEEEPRRVVLETPLTHCDCRRDVATIISWADTLDLFRPFDSAPSNSVHEVALSFETPEGCSRIWEDICSVQGRVASEYRIEEYRNGIEHDDNAYDNSLLSHNGDDGHISLIANNIAPLNRQNIENIVRTLRGVGPSFKARFAHELANVALQENRHSSNGETPKFTLQGVLDLYDEVDRSTEDPAKRKEELSLLFELVKFICLLDDKRILEMILSDECFERVAGCLENDPGMPFQPEHRRFLQKEAKFNQVVPITDPKVQTMITQRFRLGFLRDVLLPRVLDELSFKRLNNLDASLSSDIAQLLHSNEEFVSNLFRVLETDASPERARAVMFLSELCLVAQKMQVPGRNAFYRAFTEDGRLLAVCERVFNDPNSTSKERLDAGEIVLHTLKHDTSIVRDRIIETENELAAHQNGTNGASRQSLMGLLVDSLINEEDSGVQAQACQLLEFILDPESFNSVNKNDDDPFLSTFYEKYFERLLSALDRLTPEARKSFKDEETPVSAAHLVCGLISFCVQTHGYLVREVIAKHTVVPKILKLLDAREKHLVLDAIRFIRICLGMKEKFYNDYVVQHNLLAPVLKTFTKNGTKNNLINSTVIDLLEFIKSENVPSLVEYVVTKFADQLRPIKSYVNTFAELEESYVLNSSGLAKSPSTQSLPSSASSAADISKQRTTLVGGVRNSRVTAASSTRSNIFGQSRPYREDDDEALFDDDVAALTGGDDPSPTKRARLESPAESVDVSANSGSSA